MAGTTTARAGLTVLALALTGIAPVHAQYPTRTVRLIVPFAAGSGTDTVARFVQPQLSSALGQQLVIDNRPGAAGNLGAGLAAQALADGYTVFMGISAHSISMTLYRSPGFDLTRDFVPVTLLATGSFTLAAHPSLPAKTVKELVAFAKRRPGEINVATAGATIRLAAKMFDSMAGTRMTEVNYKSTPQAITAVVSGEASVGFPATSAVMPHARAGKLRALAVTTPRRSSMAPDIPTLAESGIPGYDVTTWYGLMLPTGTTKEIVDRLHGATASALAHPVVKERFSATDLEPKSSSPEEFGAYIRSEIAKWAKVIKASGIRIE
ncbi:MAG TPA: tripartite tricarboxylate transporter substrate binding protein [Burkholderiales bacterium]|nr:tripartite tricarboxylate transporter substrate binding protein [Burkholderiales bacterium]